MCSLCTRDHPPGCPPELDRLISLVKVGSIRGRKIPDLEAAIHEGGEGAEEAFEEKLRLLAEAQALEEYAETLPEPCDEALGLAVPET